MESVTHKLNSLDEYVGYKNLRETKEEELLLSRIRMVRSALTQEYEKTMARLRKFERYCVLR